MTADMAAAYAADSTERDSHEVEARFATGTIADRRCDIAAYRAACAFAGRLALAYEQTRRGATDHVATNLGRAVPR